MIIVLKGKTGQAVILFYGYFRAVGRPGISVGIDGGFFGIQCSAGLFVIRTACSGGRGIWISVPVGLFLAGLAGLYFLFKIGKREVFDCEIVAV